jgi:hypothetical protein
MTSPQFCLSLGVQRAATSAVQKGNKKQVYTYRQYIDIKPDSVNRDRVLPEFNKH